MKTIKMHQVSHDQAHWAIEKSACPFCGTSAGQRCMEKNRRAMPKQIVHAARVNAGGHNVYVR